MSIGEAGPGAENNLGNTGIIPIGSACELRHAEGGICGIISGDAGLV